ncbi:hypothetical protein PV08_04070 [Exophiala spinifera]|uniref:Zn(2)-C6 fungal-type domain-containing protein n=1 Tax=Exophiala spinifera TaxID=91928 RepID=A0A0D2BE56_9EURO|nr:uncharacterized protein PV08_04070 [Exophiala spinifera]KIW16880.1 hypothetical protein PV08_04070 [Exophiala spinifera]
MAQRQRKWHPKTRTGCKTCKIRKKKCDEAKPICNRCIKDKFTCDGYDAPRAWLFTRPEEEDVKFTPASEKNGEASEASSSSQCPADVYAPFSDHEVVDTCPVADALSVSVPSSPWTSETDRNFCQYFLLQLAPLLTTTKQWDYFWRSTVPQAAWLDSSINHAMVAVAATYESRKSGIDRTELILSRSNQAIRAFTASQTSTDLALILCRLLSSIAQCNGDYRTATMHMNYGQKMLQEGARALKSRSSDIIRLMAPTVMALSTYAIDDSGFSTRIAPEKYEAFHVLKTIRMEYGRLLHSLSADIWERADSATNSLLSIAWSTLTQAFSSVLHPDIVSFANDPVVPVAQIIGHLQADMAVLSIDELNTQFRRMIRELRYFLTTSDGPLGLSMHQRQHLKRLVENYLVQAAEVEPKMTAGTFCVRSPNRRHPLRFYRTTKPPNSSAGNVISTWNTCANIGVASCRRPSIMRAVGFLTERNRKSVRGA